MDLILELADHYFLDEFYQSFTSILPSSASTFAAHHLLLRSALLRQSISLLVLNAVAGIILYLILATASFYAIYDHNQMRHSKFLPNQIQREIQLSLISLPIMSFLMLPLFLWEIHGYARLYDSVEEYGWWYLLGTIPLYLFFTDMCIYWYVPLIV
jgi:lathosterol oxidase